MRLYSMFRNSAGWRVRIALELKGIAYEYVATSSLAPGAYQRLNPQGLMPALEIDGEIIAQSSAILELLEERYPDPPLLPQDSIERARVRSFAQVITADLHPINNTRIRKYLAGEMGQTQAAIDSWVRHWCAAALGSLEEMLDRRRQTSRFCFGDTPGWADLHLVPQLYNCRRYGCDLTPYPRLLAADAACREVEAFRRAAPESMPDFPPSEPAWFA